MRPMPQIRLFEFSEQRIRKPVVGGLIDEFTDQLLTEPLPAQVERFVSLNEHYLFMPVAVFNSYTLNNDTGETWVSISYTFPGLNKTDLVRLMYG